MGDVSRGRASREDMGLGGVRAAFVGRGGGRRRVCGAPNGTRRRGDRGRGRGEKGCLFRLRAMSTAMVPSAKGDGSRRPQPSVTPALAASTTSMTKRGGLDALEKVDAAEAESLAYGRAQDHLSFTYELTIFAASLNASRIRPPE